MPKWFAKFNRGFQLRRKKVGAPVLPTIEDQLLILTTEKSQHVLNRRLGDIVEHSSSPDELVKKEIGIPLLQYTRLTNTLNTGYRSKPTESVLFDPCIGNDKTPLTYVKDGKTTNITAKSRSFRRLFSSAKAALSGKRTKTKPICHGKEITSHSLSFASEGPSETAENSSRVDSRISSTRAHDSEDQRLLLHITPGGEVNPVKRHLSEVCESEKILEGSSGIVVTHFPPELYRSSENCNKSLIAFSDPEKLHRNRRFSAKLSVVNISQDSCVKKATVREPVKIHSSPFLSVVKETDNTSLSNITPIQNDRTTAPSWSATQKLSTSVGQITDNNTMNGEKADKSTEPILYQPPSSEVSGEESTRKKNRPKREKKNKSIVKKNKKQPTKSSAESDSSTKAKEQDVKDTKEKNSFSEQASTDSRMSNWCRQICEQDRKLGYRFQKVTECSCNTVRGRINMPCRKCRLKATIVKCSNRPLNHPLVRNVSPPACNQGVSVLMRQADVMIEELIDRLAWDLADGILARASYAKSLSCRSSRKTVMLLKALVSCRQGVSPDTSSTSLPFLSSSRRSSLLED
ncbi:hypothetical protein EG68_02085 [Paragonimus skrjabini miyazakii]|uniref:Uncharacterized protein n=1 Tax=Paragonimus skrjabini miyazakii TaxID=59628 RepID=A0A8S9Z423_9TREM|nr:hypothetical protein EG68_02085 [Paragonimus skrjabini miyazakii]